MGLESLSRGAAHATFFEQDRSAVARLRQNIAALGVEGRCQVVSADIFKWFGGPAPKERADLIFLDPPYRFLREAHYPAALQRLAERMAIEHLAAEGTVIFRHDVADALALPGLGVYDARTYGGMALELLSGRGK